MPHRGSIVKEVIRQRALELGFDACGFTTAEPPASLPLYQHWIEQGHHGAMAYLERGLPKRADLNRILPGIKTVVVLAAAHSPGTAAPESATPRASASQPMAAGVVARYARHVDYHEVLAHPLQALADAINAAGGPDTRSLGYVDTGPILERDLAQRAGVGFVGKHTGLIRTRGGNWFLLAEILTTLELPPDSPERNRCGSCVRCIGACPTRAIIAPFQLDARRCISYLTIELRGSIPLEFRPAIGNRIFGCDDCLAICPWNRFARDGALLRAHARPELGSPDLIELLGLTEETFRQRFRDTPLWRAKRRGLLRNVCVALGNSGDPRALPALDRAAHDPEPLIAEHAEWARARIRQQL
jgi:epoxyqueuosine reductase